MKAKTRLFHAVIIVSAAFSTLAAPFLCATGVFKDEILPSLHDFHAK